MRVWFGWIGTPRLSNTKSVFALELMFRMVVVSSFVVDSCDIFPLEEHKFGRLWVVDKRELPRGSFVPYSGGPDSDPDVIVELVPTP